jgi:hypothetical protein
MIITKNGNLMPRVFFASFGHEMNVVLTLVPAKRERLSASSTGNHTCSPTLPQAARFFALSVSYTSTLPTQRHVKTRAALCGVHSPMISSTLD